MSATVDLMMSEVVVLFNQATNQGGYRGLFICSDIVVLQLNSSNNVTRSDKYVLICYWSSSRQIRLSLPCLLPVGDLLRYVGNAIVLRANNGSQLYDAVQDRFSIGATSVEYDRSVLISIPSEDFGWDKLDGIDILWISSISVLVMGITKLNNLRIMKVWRSAMLDVEWKGRNCTGMASMSSRYWLSESDILKGNFLMHPPFITINRSECGDSRWIPLSVNMTKCNWHNQCNTVPLLIISSVLSETYHMLPIILPASVDWIILSTQYLIFSGDLVDFNSSIAVTADVRVTWNLSEEAQPGRVLLLSNHTESADSSVFRLSPNMLMPGKFYHLIMQLIDVKLGNPVGSRILHIHCEASPFVITITPPLGAM